MELNECIITGIYNCPHEKIDGKTCSYCKIPDEPKCKNKCYFFGDDKLCHSKCIEYKF